MADVRLAGLSVSEADCMTFSLMIRPLNFAFRCEITETVLSRDQKSHTVIVIQYVWLEIRSRLTSHRWPLFYSWAEKLQGEQHIKPWGGWTNSRRPHPVTKNRDLRLQRTQSLQHWTWSICRGWYVHGLNPGTQLSLCQQPADRCGCLLILKAEAQSSNLQMSKRQRKINVMQRMTELQ